MRKCLVLYTVYHGCERLMMIVIYKLAACFGCEIAAKLQKIIKGNIDFPPPQAIHGGHFTTRMCIV